MPSTKRYGKKDRKRARSNDSDTDDEFERFNRKNGRNPFKISEILKNYQSRCLDSPDKVLKYVPEPVKDIFIPYMKHVQMINMNFNLMNSLFKSKSELLKPELVNKFQDMMNKTVNKMNKFSGDFIEQLASNYSQDTVYETLKASCQEPVVNLDKIQDPDEKPAPVSNPPPITFDSYDEFMDSDIDLQISEVCDNITNDVEINDVKAQEPSNNLSNDTDKKKESNDILPDGALKNLQFDDEGYLLIYTDGCCLANGRDNAQAGIGVWFNHNHSLNVAAPAKGVPTNNNAEIQAATKAIRIASSIDCKKVRICTDSMFLINCMTTWVKNWKRNNWRTAEKQPVKNRESLEELDSVIKLVDSVQWKHILGHKGCPGNEGADALAKRGAHFYRR